MIKKPAVYDKRLFSIADYEKVAKTRMDRQTDEYYNSAANEETSYKQQSQAYADLKLVQRTFVDPDKFEGTEATIFGSKISSPICVTSTAFQRMATPEGELATARACNKTKTPLALSSYATASNEEVAAAAPDSFKVYQVYMSQLQQINEDIWRRVKASGFAALVLTCDRQYEGKRLANKRTGFSLPSHLRLGNYKQYMGEDALIKTNEKSGAGLPEVLSYMSADFDWTIVPEIKRLSGLPVFAKGIMCREDVRLAHANEVDGIYVSNHGARQLDTTPATIEVLKEICFEVRAIEAETGKKLPVWFDGGVRSGGDVLKALALGADLVWIGRPVLWALSCEGQTGVENILRLLNEELREAMLMTGCYNLEDIHRKKILYEPTQLLLGKL